MDICTCSLVPTHLTQIWYTILSRIWQLERGERSGIIISIMFAACHWHCIVNFAFPLFFCGLQIPHGVICKYMQHYLQPFWFTSCFTWWRSQQTIGIAENITESEWKKCRRIFFSLRKENKSSLCLSRMYSYLFSFNATQTFQKFNLVFILKL